MVSAYTTEAPPPATMVHTRPYWLRMVSLRDEPEPWSSFLMKASSGNSARPKGAGN